MNQVPTITIQSFFMNAATKSAAIRDFILTPVFPNPAMPILNNWGVVIGSTNAKPLDSELVKDIETHYAFTKTSYIQELHDFIMQRYGYDQKVYPRSLTVDGSCDRQAKMNGMCRPFFQAKDTCAGCGKSWLAGSYFQPSRCVPQKQSTWQARHSDYILNLISKTGGTSSLAPLVTTEGGKAFRIIPITKRR